MSRQVNPRFTLPTDTDEQAEEVIILESAEYDCE